MNNGFCPVPAAALVDLARLAGILLHEKAEDQEGLD
jgi:hypothetical protein